MRLCAAVFAIALSLAGWLSSSVDVMAAPEAKTPAAAVAATSPAKDDAATAKASPVKKEYKPPYPNRTNFFEPAEGAVEQVQSTVQNVNSRQTILLKGFVSFPDEPIRAVMNINDKIVQLAAGESFGGVHIVSTEPPNATVQNEEKSWTLNLMKQPDPRVSAKVNPRSFSTMNNHAASEHAAGSRAEMRLRTP